MPITTGHRAQAVSAPPKCELSPLRIGGGRRSSEAAMVAPGATRRRPAHPLVSFGNNGALRSLAKHEYHLSERCT